MRESQRLTFASAGGFTLPTDPSGPWILPRERSDSELVRGMMDMPHRLADYGYAVSTGPLVWNRHKHQLRAERGVGRYPLIWAEAVTPDGEFVFRAQKRNHEPYFEPGPSQDWLITRQPCVLLQRTTAKEQHRRLIAAELPESFLALHGAAIVENHLNMIRPTNGGAKVPAKTLTALLNSAVADRAFRCINGSVAVSAYELEALPLPDPKHLRELERLVIRGAERDVIDRAVAQLYLGEPAFPPTGLRSSQPFWIATTRHSGKRSRPWRGGRSRGSPRNPIMSSFSAKAARIGRSSSTSS